MTADSMRDEALRRIEAREANIGIIGLGYVGLPLILEFGKQGFQVTGFDIDPEKVEALKAGRSYIKHIRPESISKLNETGRFTPTTDFSAVHGCDAVLLCVPTPLTAQREPDMSYVRGTCEEIAPHLKCGQLIILESTTYPGTTEEVMIPILVERSGLGADEFYVAYSPEREDPNNKNYTTATIPKVVGGYTPDALAVAAALYKSIVTEVIPVSSCGAAEATKLVENIFRSVNIAMVNELKVVFQRMGIDIWEVINAAKTKPFGYMPFYPGPGLGGHCIPIDPFYLTWKAREYDMPTKFIELAGEINTQMPYYVLHQVMEALNCEGKALKGSHILLIGLAYKSDVDDLRESPTLKLIELFSEKGALVEYHDPYISELHETRKYPEMAGKRSVPLEKASDFDAVVISTAHSCIDYQDLARRAKLIIDTRNAMASVDAGSTPVYKA